MNKIINKNIKIIEELNIIKNENDKIQFLSSTLKLYKKINDKK